MNSALLLVAACALGAHPVCCTSTCKDCCPASSECCEKEGFLSKLRNKLKCGSGCDSCQIQCPHPGPIPGTEHPTLKQRVKDCVCPCNSCPTDCCGKSWKTSCTWDKHGCADSCGSCKTAAGLLNRLFGRFSRCKDSCDDCCGETVIVTPGSSPAPRMPKADESKKEQLPLPSGPKKVERIEMMPLRTISQPASPVEYSIPKTLDLGKSPY